MGSCVLPWYDKVANIKKNNFAEHIRADTAGSAEAISKKKFKSESRIFRFRRYGFDKAFRSSKDQKNKMLDAYYEKKLRRAHIELFSNKQATVAEVAGADAQLLNGADSLGALNSSDVVDEVGDVAERERLLATDASEVMPASSPSWLRAFDIRKTLKSYKDAFDIRSTLLQEDDVTQRHSAKRRTWIKS